MNSSHQRSSGARSSGALACLATLALACTAELAGPVGGGTGGSAGSGGAGGSGGGGGPSTEGPGWIPIHRLNNAEYNNAVADLLGTSLRPADYFQAQTATGFNTNAGTLANLDAAAARAYFDAAKTVVDDVFANADLKAQVVTCTPTDATDTACAQSIVQAVGRRAWRRPLTADELALLVGRYSQARAELQKDHEGAVAHVLRILITAAPFTYFVEKDPDLQAAVLAKQPLSGYQLAQRLSFMLWGSGPDSALLDLAQGSSLSNDATLSAQVDRLLDDAKGQRFVQLFMEQWLNITRLRGHSVDAAAYPAWSEELRAAMLSDASSFLSSFVFGQRPWSQFLTAPLDTGNPALSSVFGADPAAARGGFLGLPAYLTAESMPGRTAPTFRGKIILDAVLCTTISLPDFPVPDLKDAGAGAIDPANIRAKLEAHRDSNACKGCHAVLDPIGLGLENFDAIGRYRTQYENGDLITPTGKLDGKDFNGLAELVPLLVTDPRLGTCPSEKLLAFALRRTPRSEDKAYVDAIAASWQSGTVRDLVKQLVLSEAFRSRQVASSAL
jgi:hypothetical protein